MRGNTEDYDSNTELYVESYNLSHCRNKIHTFYFNGISETFTLFGSHEENEFQWIKHQQGFVFSVLRTMSLV